MEQLKFKKIGLIKLGGLVAEAIADLDWTQLKLGEELVKIGYPVENSKLSRFINGSTASPEAMLIYAIAKLEICRIGSRSLTHEELLLIGCEVLSPEKLKEAEKSQPGKWVRGQRLIGQAVKRLSASELQLLRSRVPGIEDLLEGKRPPLQSELPFLGILFPDRDLEPLFDAYGVSDRAIAEAPER